MELDTSTLILGKVKISLGRNGSDGGRKQGGIKVHAMMDTFSEATGFVRMTAAGDYDRKSLYHPNLPANSLLVSDKVYNISCQFAK